MLKILMFNNEFPPLGGGTGIANYHHLVQYAQYSDVKIDLITSSSNKKKYEVERFNERITIHRVPIHKHRGDHFRGSELIHYAIRSTLYARSLLQKKTFNLSIAYSGIPAGIICLILKKTSRLPYLVLVRGSDLPYSDRRYKYLYPILTPLIKTIWREANIVSVVSLKQKEKALQICPGLPLSVITNGVDTTLFKAPSIKHYGKIINILCVGRLVKNKRQDKIIYAFANLQRHFSGIRLTLVGAGNDEKRLKALSQKLHINHLITFTGQVPHENVLSYYQASDIFVLMSENEGMSNALLEAISSGLPVIASNTGGTKELVIDKQNGFIVNKNDLHALIEALKLLIESSILRQQMGKKSSQIARSYSWEKECEKYLQLCRKTALR